VPQQWLPAAQTAVSAANADPAAGVTWQISGGETADVRLQSDGEEGLLVAQTPLVLAVPFTLDWEEVTGEEAQAILDLGNEQVTLLPWSELDASRKALRIDGRGPAEPDYPLQETWSLVADPDYRVALHELLPHLQAAWPQPPVHLLAVGDVMLDRSLGQALQRGDLAYPFVGVADQLRAADITVGNLESALGDIGEPAPKRYPFRAPPEAAAALELAGFDIVSLANNHAMDYGPQALHQAIALLQEANVAAVGAGANAQEAHAPLLIEQGGLTLAFLSYVNVPVEASSGFDTAVWTATSESPGLAWADPAQIKADIAGLGEEVDVTIVMLHSGIEYQAAPGEAQQEAARTAIDAGADLVIGHHAHILQGIELYGEGVIIYGTGNFAFEIDGDPATALFHIWLDRQGVREIRLEPVLIQFGGQPRLAEPWIAPGIRRTVYALSNLLNGR
jgi:poly-gamma-glutamate synthesis protein (capsule biosynthesis protein)